jgi:hypothetical protein
MDARRLSRSGMPDFGGWISFYPSVLERSFERTAL